MKWEVHGTAHPLNTRHYDACMFVWNKLSYPWNSRCQDNTFSNTFKESNPMQQNCQKRLKLHILDDVCVKCIDDELYRSHPGIFTTVECLFLSALKICTSVLSTYIWLLLNIFVSVNLTCENIMPWGIFTQTIFTSRNIWLDLKWNKNFLHLQEGQWSL